MSDLLAGLLFAVIFLVGLVLIPLGLPGLWVMILAIIGYGALTEFRTVTLTVLLLVITLGFVGELIEWWAGFRYSKRYGGSRRAGWGALIGGLVGAVVGIPVPVIGSVIGSLLGTFAGAVLFQMTAAPGAHVAVRAGWGALVGRAWATAAKMAIGFMIAVIGMYTVLR